MSIEQREADQVTGVALPETQNLVGHKEAFEVLISALDAGRLPSGVLLHGPRGIGKATFAFALTRLVLERTSDEASDRIAAQVEALSHPNLFVLRRAQDSTTAGKFYTAIRVDEVRALRDALHRTRGRAGHRIAIIDSADDFNTNSANALLKILEEPPADTLFIVLSHRPGGLLPTIRSRCQSFGLRPLSAADTASVLTAARPDVDEGAIAQATRLAGGRPRRGLETLLLEEGDVLDALRVWLQAPDRQPVKAQLTIADALASSKGAEPGFAQEMIRDWIATEAGQAARAGQRFRLASANTLWDKANALVSEAEIYNLDRRQTLTAVFDMIRDHARKTTPASQAHS